MQVKIIIFAILAVLVVTQNPGSKIHVTTNFLNSAKNWAIPRFLPGNKIDFSIPEQHIMGVKCYDMNGQIEVSNDKVNFEITENVLKVYVNNIYLSMNAKLDFKIFNTHISPSAHCSFNSAISMGVNSAGQLQVTSMSVNDFKIPDTSASIPGVFKMIVNYFIHMINEKVQSKINDMMPEIQGKINQLLSQTPTDVNFGNLPVTIDSTFSSGIKFTNNQMIVENNLFGWNNQKPKARPPFTNDFPFPDETITNDFTLYLSEYSLNSISYSVFDTGMMNQKLNFKDIEKIVNIDILKTIFEDIEKFLNKDTEIDISIHANTFPQFNVTKGVFGLTANFTTEVNLINDGKTTKALGLHVVANLGVSAQVINGNSLQIQIVNATLKDLGIDFSIFKSIDDASLTNLINMLLSFYIPKLNAQYFSGTIPLNGPSVSLQNASVDILDHIIKVQATPVFV